MMKVPMNRLVMLVGLPASGKSTFVRHYRLAALGAPDLVGHVHVASLDNLVDLHSRDDEQYPDAWARMQRSGELKLLEKEMFAEAGRFISIYESYTTLNTIPGILIWDQTNLTIKSRAKKLEMFNHPKWFKVAYVFEPSLDELERRLDVRREQTGKAIPPAVMESMYKSYEKPTEDEGFNLVIEV